MSIAQSVAGSVASSLASSVAGSGGDVVPFIPINLIGVSEQFDHASWAKTRLTVSANTANGPTGTLTADKLVDSVDASDHKISKGAVVASATLYTFSVYLKMLETRWVCLYNAAAKGRYFDLQAGAMGGTFAGAPDFSTITPAENGYFRCSISVVSTSATSTNFLYLGGAGGAPSLSYAGNGTDGLLAWGAQLEIGGTVNTYVPAP